MAQKFTLALAGIGETQTLLPLVERALKKFFLQSQYEIVFPAYPASAINEMRQRLDIAKAEHAYGIDLRNYKELEVRALVMLENTDADAALAVDTGYSRDTTGAGVMSHFHAKALILDTNVGRKPGLFRNQFYPSISEYTEHFLERGGSTPEQIESGQKTVLKGVVRGWKFFSNRYDGILKQLRLTS